MDRRNFFRLIGAGVAGVALEQAIPFGRVWSFPSTIVLPQAVQETWVTPQVLLILRNKLHFADPPIAYDPQIDMFAFPAAKVHPLLGFDDFSLRYLAPAIERAMKDDNREFSQVFVCPIELCARRA